MQKAEIHIVHFYHVVLEVDTMGQTVSSFYEGDDIAKISEDSMKKLKDEIHQKYPDIEINTSVIQGLLGDGIVSLCESQKVDLIVCGTNGTDWLGEHLLGTNTTSIMRSVEIPILVIPEKASFTNLKKIVFVTDFQFSDVEVLSDVANVAKPFSSSIEVIHMSEIPSENEDALDWIEEIANQRVTYPKITYQNLSSEKPTFSNLNEFLKKEKADLLVMTTKGKNFFERMFSGSLTQDMACHSTIPLLVYHINNNKLN